MPEAETDLFADFAPRAEEHFRICFFGAVLQLLGGVVATVGSFEQVSGRFPFLVGYNNELAERLSGLSSAEAQDRWCAALEEWEHRATIHLPLRALRLAAGVTHAELMWLLASGLAEEDARFGALFEGTAGVAESTPANARFLAPLPATARRGN